MNEFVRSLLLCVGAVCALVVAVNIAQLIYHKAKEIRLRNEHTVRVIRMQAKEEMKRSLCGDCAFRTFGKKYIDILRDIKRSRKWERDDAKDDL